MPIGLEGLLPSDDSILANAMRYSVLNGGKRLRPILVYIVSELGSAEGDSLDILAGSIELIHCYSLIHDDLPSMDNDDLRRGIPTTHKEYNEATAILAGDALQPLAFELLSRINTSDKNKIAIIESLAKACGYKGMVGGQITNRFLSIEPACARASYAIPAVIAPSPITAVTCLFSFFFSAAVIIPSAALMEVLEWPTPKVSYSLSDLTGKGARPLFCLILSISSFLGWRNLF